MSLLFHQFCIREIDDLLIKSRLDLANASHLVPYLEFPIKKIQFDVVCASYFPIQKLANILPNKSSFVIWPVISPK